jgi:hypothetical protein
MRNATLLTLAASRSTDGGRTWSPAVIVSEVADPNRTNVEFPDKQWMAVDTTGGPFDGHVYLLWLHARRTGNVGQSRIAYARSTDRGLTWSEPQFLTEYATSANTMVDVGPDGEVYIGYFRQQDGLVLRRSDDGGATFGPPVRLPSITLIGGTIPNTRAAAYRTLPTLLADRSTGRHRGTVYLVLAGAATSTSGQRVAGVAVSRSLDRGATWSTPQFVSTPSTGDALFPHGAIDQATGELVLQWLDRRDDPTNTLARLYVTRSRDGAVTFDSPTGVTPPFSLDADWIGDYYSVAAHAGVRIGTFSPASGTASAVRVFFDDPAPAGPRRRAVRP